MKISSKCNICTNRLINYKTHLKCSLCFQFSHPKCNFLSKTEAEQLHQSSDWTCYNCNRETFPLINNHFEKSTHDNYNNTTECYSCSKILGKQFSECCTCGNKIHNRCKLDNFGCKRCRDDIFPQSCDLFSNGVNNLIFDPYDPESMCNQIGHDDDYDHENEYWHSLSKNLRKCKYTSMSSLKTSSQNKFRVLSLNIQSLKSNFSKLKDEIENLQKFDAICLCETNISPEETVISKQDLYCLDGFNIPIFQTPSRKSNKGGGLAIYINSNTFDEDAVKILEDFSTSTSPEAGEFLFVEINTGVKNKNIILGNFYRSPSFKPDMFIEKLSEIHSFLKKYTKKNILLMGDANIDLIQHNISSYVQNYLNVMTQHGFVPVISRPTRITDHSMTLIDHIFTNSITNFVNSGILMDPFADHLGPFANISLDTSINLINKGHYAYSEFNEENIKKFHDLIRNSDWQNVYDSNNADSKYNKFLEIYSNCYKRAFPSKTRKFRNPRITGKPWMVPWLIEACDRKNNLYALFVKHPTKENKEKYIKYKKWVEKQIYRAKRKFYSNQISKYSSDAKKQWKTLNEIINRRKSKSKITKLKIGDREIVNNSEICNNFNKYFCSIATELRNEIKTASSPVENVNINTYLKACGCRNSCACTHSSIFLEPCTESEICNIIKQLSNTSSSDFNTAVLKTVNYDITKVLTDTINASLDQGIFPTALKVAKVIPIHKSGKKNDMSNYRPISLLSVFSKIYEKIMYQRVIAYLNKNNLLYNRQYGFRSGHSCEHALIDAQSHITKNLDKKETSLLLLLDFSKAFDMVDHKLLLKKLYWYGIRGTAHHWFESYLAHRKQYVGVNNHTSTIGELDHGVPQGSILGPLLFIIFINDMPNIFPGAHFIMYADDANIIISGKTIGEIEEKIKLLIPKLSNWVQGNMLKLNTTKTKYMLISNLINHDFNIIIGNKKIARVTQEKFLGVIVDDKLTFNAHRQALAKKIANNCGVLFRARHILNMQSLKLLYYSFIQSHMVYCSGVWGLGSKTSLNSIFLSQKRAVRIMSFTKLYKKDKLSGVYTYGHTKKIFKEYNLLSVHNLVLTQALNLLQKIKLGRAPVSISELFEINNQPQNSAALHLSDRQIRRLNRLGINSSNIITSSENTNTLFINELQANLKVRKQCFDVLGPRLYNNFTSRANRNVTTSTKAIKHENLPLNVYKSRIKHFTLKLQHEGDGIHWDPNNFPRYTFTNRDVVLRSDLTASNLDHT